MFLKIATGEGDLDLARIDGWGVTAIEPPIPGKEGQQEVRS
jgi:hypothetical protein